MVLVENPTTNTIQIDNYEVSIKEYQGERVVTFKDIDTVHKRVEGTSGRNFRQNKEHFIEGTDYFKITPDEFRRAFGENSMDKRQTNLVVLLTECGYLMLAKSLTDKKAWEVQRQLVNTYFRVKQVVSDNILLAEKNAQLVDRIDKLEKTLKESLGTISDMFSTKFTVNMKSVNIWKRDIVYPIIEEISSMVGQPKGDCYKMVYAMMKNEYGFCESVALNGLQDDWDCENISTINAIAVRPIYQEWFVQAAKKLIKILATSIMSSDTISGENQSVTPIQTTQAVTSDSDIVVRKFTINDSVEEVINGVAEIIGDKSKNKLTTMRKIYAQITTQRGWKNLLTRNRCNSKKELVAKVEKYHKKFINVCNNMVSNAVSTA